MKKTKTKYFIAKLIEKVVKLEFKKFQKIFQILIVYAEKKVPYQPPPSCQRNFWMTPPQELIFTLTQSLYSNFNRIDFRSKTDILTSSIKYIFPSCQVRETNSFVRFLGEVTARQFCFEIYWPLANSQSIKEILILLTRTDPQMATIK